ncbi:MAG: type II toxin-antitoxin system Phd/YefM family antitoxin [Actinomycetota bacterium]
MDTMAIGEFKAKCLAELERVRRTGRPLLVTKRGKPVAQILPPPKAGPPASPFGVGRGTFEIVGDIVSPAVPAEEWEALR